MTSPGKRPDLAGFLDALVERCPQIIHAVLLTGDGLLMATSKEYGKDNAERTAAVMSTIASSSEAQSAFCDHEVKDGEEGALPWEGTFIGLRGRTLIVLPSGNNSRLAVSVRAPQLSQEAAAAAQETVTTISRLQKHFATEARKDVGGQSA